MSLFVSILEGEYDAELKWPFVGEVTVTLLNQLQDVNHHTKVIRFNAINDRHAGESWGFPTFIAHSALAHKEHAVPQGWQAIFQSVSGSN